jgi:hypothetical protein
MISIAHVLIGGAVGVATGNPVAAFVGGVASHFVADMTPHLDVPPSAPRTKDGQLVWTPQIWIQVFIDIGLAGLISLGLWHSFFGFPKLSPFILGAFGGIFPDLVDNVPFWSKKLHRLPGFKQFSLFHNGTHRLWEDRFSMRRYYLLGIITQVVAVTLSLLSLF